MKLRTVFFFVLACWALPLFADDGHHHLMPGEKIGNVSFPTSCSAQVQPLFERGVALLH